MNAELLYVYIFSGVTGVDQNHTVKCCILDGQNRLKLYIFYMLNISVHSTAVAVKEENLQPPYNNIWYP